MFLRRFWIPRMRNVVPIPRNAIQAGLTMTAMATPTMRKTIPTGSNAELPYLSVRVFLSKVGFVSSLIYARLRGPVDEAQAFGECRRRAFPMWQLRRVAS